MPSKLWRLLEETGSEERVIVMSAFDEQTDRFNLYAQNKVAIGAGNDEVKKAYASYSSKLDIYIIRALTCLCILKKWACFR